jgi:hypothetical protein
MTSPLRPREHAVDRPGDAGYVVLATDWLRLARLARLLSWFTLAWMGVEGGVAIGAAVAGGYQGQARGTETRAASQARRRVSCPDCGRS